MPNYRPVRRVAMPVVHSNPLAEPGAGDAGGMTVYVREVARALAARGVEVDIFTRRDDVDTPEQAHIAPGVRVFQIKAGPETLTKEELPSYLPEFTSNLMDLVEMEEASYDIIHSHYWLSGKVAARLKVAWNTPFVHTFHTLGRVKNEALRIGDYPEPPWRLAGEGRVISEACAIVASTAEERRSLIELYAAQPEKIHLIPPGVDHRLFRPGDQLAARGRLGIAADAQLLLFVGRLQPLKAVDTAIRALAALLHDGPGSSKLKLMIVGGPSGLSGSEEVARLKALASELGVSDRLTMIPAQPQIALADFYQAADVCLVPSYAESFGLVALEAQACGLPVIASAVGGLRHIVKDGQTGFLVEPGHPAEFARRALQILTDRRAAEAMGRDAAAASLGFSWSRSANELHQLYSSSEHLDCKEALVP